MNQSSNVHNSHPINRKRTTKHRNPTVFLTDQFGLGEALERIHPAKLISLLNPNWMIETPKEVPWYAHLKIEVNDFSVPFEGATLPQEGHIQRILEFGEKWHPDELLLVHCAAARSRSPAAILILLAQKNPGREMDLALTMRKRAPQASPNSLMVELGDRLLRCEGRLIEAVRSMAVPTLRDSQGRLVGFPALLP